MEAWNEHPTPAAIEVGLEPVVGGVVPHQRLTELVSSRSSPKSSSSTWREFTRALNFPTPAASVMPFAGVVSGGVALGWLVVEPEEAVAAAAAEIGSVTTIGVGDPRGPRVAVRSGSFHEGTLVDLLTELGIERILPDCHGDVNAGHVVREDARGLQLGPRQVAAQLEQLAVAALAVGDAAGPPDLEVMQVEDARALGRRKLGGAQALIQLKHGAVAWDLGAGEGEPVGLTLDDNGARLHR
jgi:hypothetical protein